MLNEAIAKIEEQQKALENSPAYWVGEQLKDMVGEVRELPTDY